MLKSFIAVQSLISETVSQGKIFFFFFINKTSYFDSKWRRVTEETFFFFFMFYRLLPICLFTFCARQVSFSDSFQVTAVKFKLRDVTPFFKISAALKFFFFYYIFYNTFILSRVYFLFIIGTLYIYIEKKGFTFWDKSFTDSWGFLACSLN